MLALCLHAAPAAAQRITGTIQGKVVRDGAVQPGARVSATSMTTGTVIAVTADAGGRYTLPGLPAGQYLMVVSAGGQESTEFIELSTGQTLDSDLDVGAAAVKGAERIEVSGKRFESRTSEVATSVSQEQLENLPQSDRNFLNFAQLAPNVRINNDPLKKNINSAGLPAPSTNVFIDGVSLKNNINDGGVVGQDSSRGNPFPQLAISGFRVLTQNYKAEYEQAGSAIISAVTKSGGNDVHGEFYGSYQDRNISSIDPFAQKLGLQKPDYNRYQVGGLLSGPIIKDHLFALATYEGNFQNRDNQVTLGNATPDNLARFGKFQGDFASPFREHLGFAKLTYIPDPAQTFDLTFSIRHETDIRSFGGTTSLQNAENDKEDTQTAALRHEWRASNGLVNEATVQLLNTAFNPTALNPGLIEQDFGGVIRIGGRDTDQDIVQRTVTLRDDVTLPAVVAGGVHQLKLGAKLALQHYQVERTQFGNPLFSYRNDPATHTDFNAPFEARFGVGDPRVTSSNSQIGLYAQDDWQIQNLTLNLGVRWDIETNPLNNDYKTPQNVRDAMIALAQQVNALNGADWFPVDNYLTDGTQRPIYFGEIQPRIGASYDLFGDQKTVAFAGAGRYFDRTLFNTGVNERYLLQYQVRAFEFSNDGLPRNGQPTILWNPSYLSKAGLQGLINSGVAPSPELDLLDNHTKPPHSDQVSAGVRQQVGPVNLSATFSYIHSSHGLGFYPVNRMRDGKRDFLSVPSFGNVLVSEDAIENKFTGLYVTAEKPFTPASPWGVTATYTLGYAKVKGDTFNFDFPRIKDTPWTPADNDERHRLVLSGLVGLPEDFLISTLMQFGTGTPYNVIDASLGTDPPLTHFRRNGGRADDFIQFKQIDLRLTKTLPVAPGHHMTAFVEVFNLFNWYNYGGYDGFIPPTATGTPNPTFGQPSVLVGPTRSFQLGLTYGF
ncbi:MAG TPA: TonB-dependent receptor [Kofleriaceae bacterium]|nr:TonB-dependent receptor [Kofleriaceae bacterium]